MNQETANYIIAWMTVSGSYNDTEHVKFKTPS